MSAVILVTEDGNWKLIYADPKFVFEKFCGRAGTWRPSGDGMGTWFYGMGIGEPSPFSLGMSKGDPDFHLTGLSFPPQITLTPQFFQNHFAISSEKWARGLGYKSPAQATNVSSSWYPIATGALQSWIKQYCEAKNAELKRLCVSLGVNVAAIFDPSAGLSLLAAIEASDRGDYLGCALNLLGAIPLLGKLAQGARNSVMAAQLEHLIIEIQVLTKWMQTSKASILRTRGLRATGLEGRLVKAVAEVPAVIKPLTNQGWIRSLSPQMWAEVGFLPEEARALGQLAKDGYYVVIRACNPERVQWLTWAAKNGVRALSKPLWIKAKSLKSGPFAGLVGYKMEGGLQRALAGKWMSKVERPPGFDPGFLARGGGKAEQVWKIAPHGRAGFGLSKTGEDAYVVQSNGYLVLVDARGSAYISDLDIAIVQRRMGSGAYGPPGMNVFGHNMPGGNGDYAPARMIWSKIFRKCEYPPDYVVIQHGELNGTAGSILPLGPTQPGMRAYDAALDTRELVWGPGDAWDTEQLVVAAPAEGLTNNVGVVKNWETLGQFHRANPLGENRFSR